MSEALLRETVGQFDVRGDYVRGMPYGSGHINTTYAVTVNQAGTPVRYILQQINHSIFQNVAGLMSNIQRVTEHQRQAIAPLDDGSRRSLKLVPTCGGAAYLHDADGNDWRMYLFIEGASTYDAIRDVGQAYEVAKAFGDFQRLLRNLPGDPLVETIPGFHDTAQRLAALQSAAEADVCGRADDVRDLIDFACEHDTLAHVLGRLQASGDIPQITVHNDTKLNNVMLDDQTGVGVCVIDLDTVMPGLSLFDFGDMVRSATRPTNEDEVDLSKVVMRVDMFEALARGFIEATGDHLSPAERAHMATSGKVLCYETGIRFLTDYLQGDVYFRTHRPGHNLDRCRVQFRMVSELEARTRELERIISDC